MIFHVSIRTPARTVTPQNGTLVSTPTRSDFNMGGKDRRTDEKDESQPSQPGIPNVYVPSQMGTQQSLDALVDKSLVGETIRLLMSALAPSTQAAYLWGWKFWSRYCETRRISPWVDTALKYWDQEILNFSTWEFPVMKIGSSALETRFSAIKFIHSMEGRGYF